MCYRFGDLYRGILKKHLFPFIQSSKSLREWGAKSEYQLQERIKLKLKEFDLDYVNSLMVGVKAKLQKNGQECVFSLHE